MREGGEPKRDRSRDTMWQEFCRKVDNGDFDTEILAAEEAEQKERDQYLAYLERMRRPTTPEDLIQSAEFEHWRKLVFGEESEEELI